MDEVLQNSKFTYLSNRQSVHFLFITFCRIQNLHISQTKNRAIFSAVLFCRIQNLHISQTFPYFSKEEISFVEFKIYISLKHCKDKYSIQYSFVEFKIYISLKLAYLCSSQLYCFVEFKIYISLKHDSEVKQRLTVLQNSKFTYLSNLS